MNNSNWTSGLYSIYRVSLGLFLTVHFLHLIPWAAEVFGNGGLISSSSMSPFMGIVPNPLTRFDSSLLLTALLSIGAISGIFLAFGKWDRVAAICSAIILAWLYQRNPLIANPSLPLIGWMLIAHCFVKQTGVGMLFRSNSSDTDYSWRLPNSVWIAAWITLGVAYSYSGYTKLLSPSWVDGTAISLVLENPLARDHFLRAFLLGLDAWVLQWLTWGITFVELIFLGLIIFKYTRIFAWTFMLFVQFGFLIFLNFADLTFPMLLIHLLTFDPSWIKAKIRSNEIIFYDGTCALCHGVIKLVLSEMQNNQYKFSPLQSSAFETSIPEQKRATLPDSFIILTEDKKVLVEGQAVVYVLSSLGGVWFVLGSILRLLPNSLLNFGYRIVAKIRFKLFGTKNQLCPVLPTDLRKQFLI